MKYIAGILAAAVVMFAGVAVAQALDITSVRQYVPERAV